MIPTTHNDATKKLLYIVAGLSGISLIILIHEAGHFLFAQLFQVAAQTFSLGFGPTLYSFTAGNTVFRIAALPFGGYVEIDPELLAAQSYIPQMLILFGGIIFNIVFAYVVLAYYLIRTKLSQSTAVSSKEIMKQAITQIMTRENANSTFIGPIGIISMIGSACAINQQCYWLILAILSLNMGILNMIPFPFFDGGKALLLTIETITGTTISPHLVWLISAIFMALFIVFIMQITMNDIRRLIKG
jgi:membrane-associated protease RseP (regulator of RpoE activity)